MPSIIIELTDFAYREALALSDSERSRIASNAFATARNQPEEPTTEEDLVAIGEGLAALDAGDVIDSDTFFAKLRARRATRATGNIAP